MDYPIGSILRRRLGGALGLLCWHWGIYVGDDLVIQFNGERKKQLSAGIRKDTVGEFSLGRTIYVHACPSNGAHGHAIHEETFRLHVLAGRNRFNGSYDFAFNNCQDFCMQCYEVDYEPVRWSNTDEA